MGDIYIYIYIFFFLPMRGTFLKSVKLYAFMIFTQGEGVL